MAQTIVWERIDFKGLEHLTFESSKRGHKASGYIVGVTENEPFAVNYEIRIDGDWRISAFSIDSLALPQRKISMTSNRSGLWFDENGFPMPEFDGCFEIDITLTPFTNTLPVRRLNFAPGEQKEISVLYVELPEFNIKRVEQFYTKLNEKTYIYEGYPQDFRAEIVFDDHGFVVDYPELFRRIYP